MTIFYAGYDLHSGYIHNWLVAGPQAVPVLDLESFTGDEFKLQIARRHHQVADNTLPWSQGQGCRH